MLRWRRWVFLAALLAAGGFASADAQTRSRDEGSSAPRVALVIGNSAYQHVPLLDNPKNDARLIADTLVGLGFAIVGGAPQIDLGRQAFETAIRDFGKEMTHADVALFYFAGHGVQSQGTNWLVPITANPVSVTDFDYEMVDASLILKQMTAAHSRLNLIILDACRNNPFGVRSIPSVAGQVAQMTRSAAGGLAQMTAPRGTLISYATQPGNVAFDGSDGHSPFSEALAQSMRVPGLDIFQLFNEVGLEVERITGGEQQPWVSNSPIDGDFYFAGRPPPGTAPPPSPQDPEVVFWESVRDSENIADFEEYLHQYPNGHFVRLARNKLRELQDSKSRPNARLAPAVVAMQPGGLPRVENRVPPQVDPAHPYDGRWAGNIVCRSLGSSAGTASQRPLTGFQRPGVPFSISGNDLTAMTDDPDSSRHEEYEGKVDSSGSVTVNGSGREAMSTYAMRYEGTIHDSVMELSGFFGNDYSCKLTYHLQ
jgi:hypothetical protein